MGFTTQILTICLLVITYGTYTNALKCHVCTGIDYVTDNDYLKGLLADALGGIGDIGANLTGAGGDSLNIFVDWCNDFSKKPANVEAQECSLMNTAMGATYVSRPSSEVEYRCFEMKNVTSLSIQSIAVDYVISSRGCALVPKTGEMVSDVSDGCHDADDNSYVKAELEAAQSASPNMGGMDGLDPGMGAVIDSETDICFCSEEGCNSNSLRETSTAAKHTATLLVTAVSFLWFML